MLFKKLNLSDFIVSTDVVTSSIWTNEVTSLTQFYTSSAQISGLSGDYYTNVYQTALTNNLAEIQFNVAFGNINGSGSAWYDPNIDGASPSRTIYGQYRNLILNNPSSSFVYTGYSGSYSGSNSFWAISIDRNRYKQSLLPGSLTLVFSSSNYTFSLTDDSKITPALFTQAGKVYNLISGSLGVPHSSSLIYSGYPISSGSFGWLLPDIGTIILNADVIKNFYSPLSPNLTSNIDGQNSKLLVNNLYSFTLFCQENIPSNFINIKALNAEFNYSINPSFSLNNVGELVYTTFVNNPQTFITSIGLYNDDNELLAVAKLSKPIKKDFTKEILIRVKLDY